ncbi:14187_t:CDS:1 [Racocetra persica]|uniref:14187_t:CDS:1 n=1 Tax=Racocetra persica TaxID=160502 RepID=A0ACA9LQW1_9GLOM|nr:14187_t:CDS:1 [Racocetra persica]
MSRNTKFNVKLISRRWYTDLMQASNYTIIESTDSTEFNTNEEMNQLISIHDPDIYRASVHISIIQKQEYVYGFSVAKSRLKFVLENGLVDEFVGLVEEFIKDHTGIDINKQMTIDVIRIKNPKKLKHKGYPKIAKSVQSVQDLNTRSLNERQNSNTK